MSFALSSISSDISSTISIFHAALHVALPSVCHASHQGSEVQTRCRQLSKHVSESISYSIPRREEGFLSNSSSCCLFPQLLRDSHTAIPSGQWGPERTIKGRPPLHKHPAGPGPRPAELQPVQDARRAASPELLVHHGCHPSGRPSEASRRVQ